MKDNLLKFIYNLVPDFIESIDNIFEIAVRNEVSALEVAIPYRKFNDKVYKKKLNIIGEEERNPDLDKRVFQLTERYLDIKKIRDLNNLD